MKPPPRARQRHARAVGPTVPVSLDGQDRRLSPARPGFDSRTGNFLPDNFVSLKIKRYWTEQAEISTLPSLLTGKLIYVLTSQADLTDARRAPLAERSAVNRQVLGSIPSGGVHFFPLTDRT